MNATSTASGCRTAAESLQEYARGIAGGLLFSLPLLYTMEVWWAGFTAHPWTLAAYVVGTLLLLLGYNRYAGIREDASFAEMALDSVEEMGIGLVLSFLLLWLLGRVTLDMPLSEALGKVVIEGMTVAIGVSIGTAQLGGSSDGDQGVRGGGVGTNTADFTGQLVLALCGAVLLAANVAPTEEVVLLAAEMSPWRLLSLAAVSIALGAAILFGIGFRGADRHVLAESRRDVVGGAVITYAIALAASAVGLTFFGRFDGQTVSACVAQIVVLGLPATLGASAGRLLLQ